MSGLGERMTDLPPIINLNKYKSDKLHKKYIEDIDAMLQIIELTVSGLKLFGHYTAAGNIITCALQNKKLLLEYRKFSEQELLK
jgi:hypothetical protein